MFIIIVLRSKDTGVVWIERFKCNKKGLDCLFSLHRLTDAVQCVFLHQPITAAAADVDYNFHLLTVLMTFPHIPPHIPSHPATLITLQSADIAAPS